MTLVKIDGKILGLKKPVIIDPSFDELIESYEQAKRVAKYQKLDIDIDLEEDPADVEMKFAEQGLKFLSTVRDYIIRVMNLNDKQIERLNKLDRQEVFSLHGLLIRSIQHPEGVQESEKDNKSGENNTRSGDK